MKRFKIRVKAVDAGFAPVYVKVVCADMVNNLGGKGMVFSAYNDVMDIDCEVEIMLVDFWLLRELPLRVVPFSMVSESLERLNFYNLKSL
jgi:hypothetical protein